VGVVLWGFETCKTYGETLGQILGYLGVRLEQGEGYFIQPEPIPLEELGRPRVDVVVNICGFFRDLFPNQLRMLDQAFHRVAALDEGPDWNYVRAHAGVITRSGGDEGIAAGRIFGPPPGEYGNRLSTMVESGSWQDESELAEMFLERSQYLYGENRHGVAAPEQLARCLGRVELVTQVRDSHEYEVTDLDHYYEFFGGMARAAEEARGGAAPTVLIADTTAERIAVRPVAEAVRRGVVTRLLNPQWIDGLLAHDFHGAQKISDRVEYLIGLDATTRSVGSRAWSDVAQRYIFDEEMRRRLLENNPYAAAEVAQKLGEALERGYWEATEEEERQLKEAYLEIEEWVEAGV
jgi:cobaltochelatase CobN/magnesium chelatase subunit H